MTVKKNDDIICIKSESKIGKDMNICIIGKNSKIAKMIESSDIGKNNCIVKYSQRETSKFNELNMSDTIIYLVSDTRTKPKTDEYVEYIYSNCFLLADLITKNEIKIKNKQFIYFSSAKVYNIFKNKEIYTEQEDMQNIPNYYELLKIARKIINISSCDSQHTKEIIEKEILPELLKLPKIEEYYPIYEYCKVISEIIIHLLLKKAYILRPTYLYGIEEDKNIIYDLIKKAFEGKKIELTTVKKDFVSYRTLIKLLNILITKNENGIQVINVSANKNINNVELKYFIESIREIIGKKIEVQNIVKCNKEYNVSNELLIKYLKNEYILEKFDENIRKIIYNYYIKEVEKLEIIEEYTGGSYARAYLVKDSNKKFILKMSIGNGAANGNIKLKSEALQIDKMKKILDRQNIKCLPEIYEIKEYSNSTFIKEEYIDGKTISDYIYEKNTDESLVENEIKNMCNLFLSIYIEDTITQKNNMLEHGIIRAKNRLEKVRDTNYISDYFKNVLTFDKIIINDVEYKNSLYLLEKIYKKHKLKFEDMQGLCLSGDIILDNVVIKENKQYIIDSRGENLVWNNGKPYFDPYYDCSKILFYFYGWKSIREERFELKTTGYDMKNTNSYINFTDEKKKILHKMSKISIQEFLKFKPYINKNESDDIFVDKLNLLAGIHFLSDTYPRIVGAGNRIKQCYAEFLMGTIIINNMYEKIMKEWE